MTQDTQLFLLDCGLAKGSWKKSQALLFNICRQLDRHLFTRQDVNHLALALRKINADQKNPTDVKGPDWEFYDRYGQAPGLVFGDNCYVTFIPVNGYYMPKEEWV